MTVSYHHHQKKSKQAEDITTATKLFSQHITPSYKFQCVADPVDLTQLQTFVWDFLADRSLLEVFMWDCLADRTKAMTEKRTATRNNMINNNYSLR